MKKIFLFVFASIALISCKKKENSPESSSAGGTTTAPVVTVKVNGADFTYSSTSAYYINPTRAVNLVNSNTSEQLTIQFTSAPTTGTFTLVKYGSPTVQYFKSSNAHRSVNGTMIVTAVTTNTSNVITKLSCTFNCQTDTNLSSSTYYNLTNGTIDYNQ